MIKLDGLPISLTSFVSIKIHILAISKLSDLVEFQLMGTLPARNFGKILPLENGSNPWLFEISVTDIVGAERDQVGTALRPELEKNY